MKRGLGIVFAWIGATVVAVAIAGAAVGSVRSQVTDAPTALGSPEAAVLASTMPPESERAPIPPEPSPTPPSTSTPSIEAAASGPSSTTVPSDTTSMTAATDADIETTATTTSSTTTTTASPVSTSTTAPSSSYAKTYDTDGGWVRITVNGDAVTFANAQPKTGWRVDVENEGPETVEIHFERNDETEEIEFSAKVEEDELLIQISSDTEEH